MLEYPKALEPTPPSQGNNNLDLGWQTRSNLYHGSLTLPFHNDTFDFSDPVFWNQIASLSQEFADDQEWRKMNGNRGSEHFIYINRTFFGLYSLLFDLKAKVTINNYKNFV